MKLYFAHSPNILKFFFFLHSYFCNYFFLYIQGFLTDFQKKINTSFSSAWGPCSSLCRNRLPLLNLQKSPLASKEGDLIFFRKEGNFNYLSERCFSAIFLILHRHRCLKTVEGDLVVLSKTRIKSYLQHNLNLGLMMAGTDGHHYTMPLPHEVLSFINLYWHQTLKKIIITHS